MCASGLSGSYLVDGTVPVRELNREFEWSLPDEGATTIAGLVIQETGTIPEPGQRFAFFDPAEILRRQRNQVTALKVTPPAQKRNCSASRFALILSSSPSLSLTGASRLASMGTSPLDCARSAALG